MSFVMGSPSRRLLVAAQMSSLGAMAYCYFLAPQVAWAYSVVAVGWFVVLAVPALTAGPLGIAGARLLATSPGRSRLPGSASYAAVIAARYVVYFVWPAVVALVLPPPQGSRSVEPIVAIVSLVGIAGVLVAAVSCVGFRRKNLAVGIAVAFSMLALAAAVILPKPPLLP